MNVIIAGSRPPKDLRLRYGALERWYERNSAVVEAAVKASGFHVDQVIQGEAQGFDTLAARWASWNQIPSIGYPAEWKDLDGKTDWDAGKKRNVMMAEDGDALVAIWDEQSRGTAHMIQTMLGLGKPVFVWSIASHRPIVDLPDALERALHKWASPHSAALKAMR